MSRNGNKRLPPRMNDRQERAIAVALERVFRQFNANAGPANKDRRTHDFVFHMTDWYADLMRLARLYKQPGKHSQAEWNDVVVAFLYHAVGHLLAAAKLNDTFSDPFDAARLLLKRARKARANGSRATARVGK